VFVVACIVPFMRTLVRGAALCLAVVGCLTATSPQLIGDGRPVLFIGNSYTYVHDVPGIVQALADSAGGERIAVETVAEPDYALVDHLSVGTAQREIAKTHWAFVVLQQGPSSVEINRDTLRLATKAFAPMIVAAGAKPALFSAWPTKDRRVDFPRAIESYQLAAADVGGVFIPVASAWLAAWVRDSTLALYESDGIHASEMGSYLTALVIYGRLMSHAATGLPRAVRLRSGEALSFDAVTAKLLQQAADAALAANP
jgi:hypothetical protein